MTFHVGQQVICISKFIDALQLGEVAPTVGCVYTVRALHPDADAILLEEIRNPPLYPYLAVPYEAFFRSRRFRPVIKTDISIFTSMLTLNKQEVDA